MPPKINPALMPFLDHLRELRKRVIYSAIAVTILSVGAFIFYDPIITVVTRPFAALDSAVPDKRFFVMSLFEGFSTKLKVSVIVGMLLSFPIILYHILKFIFPGLRSRERKILIAVLVASFLLIIISIYLSFFFLIPATVKLMTDMSFIPKQVGILLNYQDNIFYIFSFMFYSLLTFQLPIVLEILMALNLLSRRMLLKNSRYIIVAIFIIAAAVTPPDAVSLLMLALPLVLLFYITILIAKICRFGEG